MAQENCVISLRKKIKVHKIRTKTPNIRTHHAPTHSRK